MVKKYYSKRKHDSSYHEKKQHTCTVSHSAAKSQVIQVFVRFSTGWVAVEIPHKDPIFQHVMSQLENNEGIPCYLFTFYCNSKKIHPHTILFKESVITAVVSGVGGGKTDGKRIASPSVSRTFKLKKLRAHNAAVDFICNLCRKGHPHATRKRKASAFSNEKMQFASKKYKIKIQDVLCNACDMKIYRNFKKHTNECITPDRPVHTHSQTVTNEMNTPQLSAIVGNESWKQHNKEAYNTTCTSIDDSETSSNVISSDSEGDTNQNDFPVAYLRTDISQSTPESNTHDVLAKKTITAFLGNDSMCYVSNNCDNFNATLLSNCTNFSWNNFKKCFPQLKTNDEDDDEEVHICEHHRYIYRKFIGEYSRSCFTCDQELTSNSKKHNLPKSTAWSNHISKHFPNKHSNEHSVLCYSCYKSITEDISFAEQVEHLNELINPDKEITTFKHCSQSAVKRVAFKVGSKLISATGIQAILLQDAYAWYMDELNNLSTKAALQINLDSTEITIRWCLIKLKNLLGSNLLTYTYII